MRRLHLLSMTCVAAFGISCEWAADPDAAQTPPVAAAPTAEPIVAATVEPRPEPIEIAPKAPAPQPDADAEARRERVDELTAFLSEQRTGLTPDEVRVLAATIVDESDRHGLDMRLVLALMYVESRYNAFAVSPVGAIGLMQILPPTGEELAEQLGIEWRGPQTLFDPVANVRMGVAYVKWLSDRYGKMSTALAAYNWGPGTVDRRLRRGTPVPRVYPGLVMDAYTTAKKRHRS